MDLGRNHPISTEITGYAASAFAYLHEKTGESAFAERAVCTGRFLARCAWDAELKTFPFEYPGPAPAYFFDCGIIVRGLLAVWRMSGDDEFLNAAVAGGVAMSSDFDAGADFHPILELPGKKPMARDLRWSRSSGCYQLKAATAWRELAEATGIDAFQSCYDRVLDFALAAESGFLPGHADKNVVMDRLHAYLYFLEALVLHGHDVCERAQRVADYLREIEPRFARSDVYAQLLRVRLLSGTGLENAESDVRELEKFQVAVDNPKLEGGFYFGRKNGSFLPYVNPVSTVFAMQALEMWREHQAGTLEPDCRIFI
jgi:hypothetical protein